MRGWPGVEPKIAADTKFRIRIKVPNSRFAVLSHLKSAYLSVFSLLEPHGYRYAESRVLRFGYLDGLDSARATAWRASDSRKAARLSRPQAEPHLVLVSRSPTLSTLGSIGSVVDWCYDAASSTDNNLHTIEPCPMSSTLPSRCQLRPLYQG